MASWIIYYLYEYSFLQDLIQVLSEHPMGKEVLREYKQTGLIHKTKNHLVQILIRTITKTSL